MLQLTERYFDINCQEITQIYNEIVKFLRKKGMNFLKFENDPSGYLYPLGIHHLNRFSGCDRPKLSS